MEEALNTAIHVINFEALNTAIHVINFVKSN